MTNIEKGCLISFIIYAILVILFVIPSSKCNCENENGNYRKESNSRIYR